MAGLEDSRQVRPSTARARDDIERAHLRDPADRTFEIYRYAPPEELSCWIRRYWIPVWDVPDPAGREQKVLQYPVTLAVVSSTYAHFIGPQRGLSTNVLVGRGWAFGVMLAPAAGALLLGTSVSDLTDRRVPLETIAALAELPDRLRQIMTEDPSAVAAHEAGRRFVEDRLRRLGDPDQESRLVNALVTAVEDDPGLTSVGQLCERFGLTERTVQRLTARRLGLSPLWLIRRRRLHEAAERLRERPRNLADVAAELGYADQAHFSRDFRTATGMTPGMTPGEFARLQAAGSAT